MTFILSILFTISTLPSTVIPEPFAPIDVVAAATTPAPTPVPAPTPIPTPTPEPTTTPDPVTDNQDPLNNYSTWAELELKDALKAGLIPDMLTDELNSGITRMEYATLAVHFYEVETGKTVPINFALPFTDTQDENILKAYALGITSGVGDGLYNPDDLVTRQEMATFIYRTLTAVYGDFSIIDD